EGCTLSEAFCCLKQTASFDTACNNAEPSKEKAYNSNRSIRLPKEETANGTRRQIEVSDTLPAHFQEYLTKVRCINLEKAMPFLKCISYEVRGRHYQAIGFANLSGGYELRDDKTFKGTIAPKDITPIFTDRAEPVCIFEGFMDFLSFLSMKEEITNHCLVMNSVSNVARTIRYLNDRHLTHIRAFLDNDEAGRRTVQDFIKAGFHVEDMNIHYKDFKDLNEYHVSSVREQQKRKAQEQTHISITGQNKKSKQVKPKMK
ncbi:toprim domain-containing protein, partial [Segatella buccae]|uniref:toprim domain-containing protein n=1 Tax=Segatella buccae TaxID=28126 RepID=UPI0006609E8B